MRSQPQSPYYVVIFTSKRTVDDPEGYAIAAQRMEELAALQPGYLGIESARGPDDVGITVSYWSSMEAIRSWKQNAEHLAIQRMGKEQWYEWFDLRIARVEAGYAFDRNG